MHKDYIKPIMRQRPLDWEHSFLATSFGGAQNENIDETDYEW